MVKVKDRPKVKESSEVKAREIYQYVEVSVSVEDYEALDSTYWYAAKSEDALWVSADELIEDNLYSTLLNDEIDAVKKLEVATVCFIADYQKS